MNILKKNHAHFFVRSVRLRFLAVLAQTGAFLNIHSNIFCYGDTWKTNVQINIFQWDLSMIVRKLATVIRGNFSALNFATSKEGRACYLKLSEILNPHTVVNRLNRATFGCYRINARIPEVVPQVSYYFRIYNENYFHWLTQSCIWSTYYLQLKQLPFF